MQFMEIPDLNMISDFEAGVKCLQNPSLISRSITFSGIEHSFWKWGALILAVVATFGSIIRRIKLLFIYIRTTVKPSAEPLLQYLNEDFDISEEDDDDEISSASSEDESLRPHPAPSTDRHDSDSSVAGSSLTQGQNCNLRNRRRRSSCERFPWSDFTAGTSVVKLWDSLALGYDYDEEVTTIWDFNKDLKLSSFFTESPAVVLAAYDRRMKGQSPAICAEWPSSKLVGVNADGVDKVYVRDNAAGLITAGDMRNITMPLGNLTETHGDSCWDANAVITDDN